MKKILKIVFISLLSFMFIFYFLSLGLYKYGISKIDPLPLVMVEKNFKDEYHDAFWSEYAHSRQGKMTKIQPYEYLLKVIDIKKEFPNSLSIASMCARTLIMEQNKKVKHKDWHIVFVATIIWVSNNLSSHQAVNSILNSPLYYSNKFKGLVNASKGYFNKVPEKLNIYQILMLQAIMARPSRYNPYKHPESLLEKVNLLIEELKKVYPEKYKTITRQVKLPW